jgi:hypothetical protein
LLFCAERAWYHAPAHPGELRRALDRGAAASRAIGSGPGRYRRRQPPPRPRAAREEMSDANTIVELR